MKTFYQKSTKTLRVKPDNYCLAVIDWFTNNGYFDGAAGLPNNFGQFLEGLINNSQHWTYVVQFIGRESNAQGITYKNKVTLQFLAPQPEKVLMAALYEDFECVSDFQVLSEAQNIPLNPKLAGKI